MKILTIFVMSFILSNNIYATDKVYPETITELMNSTGKFSEIIIPVPEEIYTNKFEGIITPKLSKEELDNTILDVKFVGDLALMKVNTNVKTLLISVEGKESGIYTYYNISNGYVLSTSLVKYFFREDSDKDIEYLNNIFDEYLLKNGFVDKGSDFNMRYLSNWLFKTKQYESESHIINISKEISMSNDIFKIEIKNKDTELHFKDISKEIEEKDLNHKYKYIKELLK